ncbi:MAG: ribosome biogenesis/translation initiation ATPase RLI [Candidatus Njordarchaeales archaeon]
MASKEPKRIAIIDTERCRPDKTNYTCMRVCPPQRAGTKVFEIDEETKFPRINEDLCIGCGICAKYCVFKAIIIVNLPYPVEKEIIHRYGPNMFALYRLPIPIRGNVTGLIGQNAIGKSTSLKILAGLLKPNLGNYENPPDWDEIIERFKGSLLQQYFSKLANKELRVVYKPQYVDMIPKIIKGTVRNVLKERDERGISDVLIDELRLRSVLDRPISKLSGGELQKLAIAVAMEKDADVYLFDEPSSYLDVLERMRVAKAIRELAEKNQKYVLVAEHDLAILDYISDYVCIYYGEPNAYGIVSKPRSVRDGINIFLEGYIPDENVRFRASPIRFTVWAPVDESVKKEVLLTYPKLRKSFNGFVLEVNPGELRKGEVIGILGPNGIGKTTFVKLIAGILRPDEGYDWELPSQLEISYKPQYLSEFVGDDEWLTVREKIEKARKGVIEDKWFRTYVIHPLRLERILDMELGDLSGGELQKVAIAHALAKKADLYLLDEPSAYISAEDRFWVAKTIKNLAESSNATIIVVEHDLLVVDYVASRLIVFEGEPGKHGIATGPYSMLDGMNKFLKMLGITFRRDRTTKRPRINKPGSKLDLQQKSLGQYYYVG